MWLWRQKSSNLWLREGDRHTSFFHLSAKIKIRKNIGYSQLERILDPIVIKKN